MASRFQPRPAHVAATVPKLVWLVNLSCNAEFKYGVCFSLAVFTLEHRGISPWSVLKFHVIMCLVMVYNPHVSEQYYGFLSRRSISSFPFQHSWIGGTRFLVSRGSCLYFLTVCVTLFSFSHSFLSVRACSLALSCTAATSSFLDRWRRERQQPLFFLHSGRVRLLIKENVLGNFHTPMSLLGLVHGIFFSTYFIVHLVVRNGGYGMEGGLRFYPW